MYWPYPPTDGRQCVSMVISHRCSATKPSVVSKTLQLFKILITSILSDFRTGRAKFMIATDVAARGLGKKIFYNIIIVKVVVFSALFHTI